MLNCLKYDFEDSWEHELVLEESRYFNPELRTELACLDGERACPPEDVGGIPGYFEFCHALKDPSHEEHESNIVWRAVAKTATLCSNFS